MYSVRKIVVILADVDDNDKGLGAVLRIAEDCNAEVTLLHVHTFETPTVNRISGNGRVLYPDQSTKALDKLCVVMERLTKRGIKGTAKLRLGQVTRSILEVAYSESADLIVIVDQEPENPFRILRPQISKELFAKTHWPILTIPNSTAQFKRALFPILQLEGALEKYDIALPIVMKSMSHVCLVGFPGGSGSDSRDSLIVLLSQMEQRLIGDGIQFSTSACLTRDLSRSLVSIASKSASDLIILTDSTANGVRDFEFETYVGEVVNRTSSAVLFICSRFILKNQLIYN